jgi:hypothetical protein
MRRLTRAALLASMAAAIAAAMPSAGASAPDHPRSLPTVAVAASQDTGRPAVTLLYQNFPNPFPTVVSRSTCIWFDLDRISTVTLTVHDVRGNLVRRLLPSGSVAQPLSPGRYGRASPSSGTGCDPALAWDGTADNGEVVPRGVYLIRLRAAGTESIKKALFQGP